MRVEIGRSRGQIGTGRWKAAPRIIGKDMTKKRSPDPALSHKKLSELTADARNANKGTARGAAMIRASLRDYGAGRSVLLDRNGAIIAGNKTVENAGALGHKDVIVVQTDGSQLVAVQRTDLDLKDPRARQLAIADNRSAEVSLEWDAETLKGLVGDGVDIAPFWSGDELEKLWPQNAELLTQEDEVPPVPVEPISKLGDLWILGEHRLLCGDSTKARDVQRLMNGEKAVLLATDPPYGVGLRLEDNHEASNAAKGTTKSYRHFEAIMGDDLDGDKLQTFIEAVFHATLPSLTQNAAWYLWHAQLSQGFFAAAAAAAANLLIHRQIIWVKPHFVFGRGDYHWQHELCFYGWVKGHRPKFYGERNQSTVWALDEGGGVIRKDQSHPSQKPVELFVRPIRNHTKAGEVCFEPFAGSGSQIIAAQKTARRCFAMEIEPRYVDVCVERWQNATGQKAALDGA